MLLAIVVHAAKLAAQHEDGVDVRQYVVEGKVHVRAYHLHGIGHLALALGESGQYSGNGNASLSTEEQKETNQRFIRANPI